MRKFLPLFVLLLITACGVDTTGISPASSKRPQGPATASVVVTEYGDLQCPACKTAHTMITKPVLQKYDDRIKFVFKQFPLQETHQYALVAAEASECAADQGKFWEFLDYDYEHQDELSSSKVFDWAKELQLDGDLFSRCVRSGIKQKAIKEEYDEGMRKGVRGTPSFFVNDVRVERNTLSDLEVVIEQALKQTEDVPL